MKNREISSQYQKLKSLIAKTSAACSNDIELQSYWAKYLCIVTAGLIENALKEIYSEYVTRVASPTVANYAITHLSRIQNPKTSAFLQLAKSFKTQWQVDLQTFVDDDGRREAIDSIMTNRHLIAHGKDSNITVAQLKNWLEKAVEIFEFMETQCA